MVRPTMGGWMLVQGLTVWFLSVLCGTSWAHAPGGQKTSSGSPSGSLKESAEP